MSTAPDRRTRKRLATRQAISDAATRLFNERGFDQVTVDDIAAAADVGRMTVFNHFARKEDMFFDLEEEGREDLRRALRDRDPATGAIEALRLFAHRAVAEQRPYVRFFEGSARFAQTVAGSEALKARARAIHDDLAAIVQEEIAKAAGRDPGDPELHLTAQFVLATWTVALVQAHRAFARTGDSEEACRLFLALVDQGTRATLAAVASVG